MSTGIVNINIFHSFQIEKVKMYHDIPYLLPKSYSKLSYERPATLDDFNVVDCQVSKRLLYFLQCSSFPISAQGYIHIGWRKVGFAFGFQTWLLLPHMKKLDESVSQSVNPSVRHSASQSVGQSVSQSVSQLVIRSGSQSVSQSVRQSICQSVSQAVNLLVSQSGSQSVSQSVSQSIRQSAIQPVIHSVSQSVSQSVTWPFSQFSQTVCQAVSSL